MDPSYFRIKLPFEEAKARLFSWLKVKEEPKLIETTDSKAIELACDENGTWKGAALFISDMGEWTLFTDLSGSYSTIPAKS